jgi:hypothetical protein
MAEYSWTVNYIALVLKTVSVHWHVVSGIVDVVVVLRAVLRK